MSVGRFEFHVAPLREGSGLSPYKTVLPRRAHKKTEGGPGPFRSTTCFQNQQLLFVRVSENHAQYFSAIVQFRHTPAGAAG